MPYNVTYVLFAQGQGVYKCSVAAKKGHFYGIPLRKAVFMIEKLYTVEEVAELASVTGRTIRNYLKSGRLVGRKIGGQWRFPQGEVQRLLAGGLPELAEDLPPESEHFFAKEAPA